MLVHDDDVERLVGERQLEVVVEQAVDGANVKSGRSL